MMIMHDLYELALSFREAIESAIEEREITEINMLRFPRGCCSYASNLLQRYLLTNNIMTFYVSGEYGDGWDVFESHAWLETEDGVVIDITGDQYSHNSNLHFSNPVYVGPRNNGFHNRFRRHNPVPCFEHEDDEVWEKNKVLYDIVIRHLVAE